MTTYQLHKTDRKIKGQLRLTGSKSISNRVLIIRALSGQDFPIQYLAKANDTDLMMELLASEKEIRDAGPAGTTFRFLTAYLALQPGSQVLTGTDRMKKRPVGVLVEALQQLGADIQYLEKEGYPPLRIGSPAGVGKTNELTIGAGTSSQFISALLMIAPVLPNGLQLHLKGKIVSRSYIEMTLGLMQQFGVEHEWRGQTIAIAPQSYQATPFTVEADWSAASYHYALAAFADELDLQLDGLFPDSFQGDAAIVEIMEQFGVHTEFNETGVRLTKSGKALPPTFEWDFILCPDIAQTMAVICTGLGIPGLFTGLETLSIKETDRIKALQNELAKVGGFLSKLPSRFSPKTNKQFFMVEGAASTDPIPTFATYEDHRMAMAFAPLAMLGKIKIEEPMVVIKSYPDFYKDLELLGFVVER